LSSLSFGQTPGLNLAYHPFSKQFHFISQRRAALTSGGQWRDGYSSNLASLATSKIATETWEKAKRYIGFNDTLVIEILPLETPPDG
jgi:hypothetical protein